MTFLTLPDHPGVFADAVLADPRGELLFLSLWARDVQILELLARIQLAGDGDPAATGDPEHHQAPDQGPGTPPELRFSGDGPGPRRVTLGDPARLRRHQGRMPPTCLYGSTFTHTWIVDPILVQPDLAHRRGMLVHRCDEPEAERDHRLWALVRHVSPVPLLEDWQSPVLEAFRDEGLITAVPGFAVAAIALDLADSAPVIRRLLRTGRLVMPDDALPPPTVLPFPPAYTGDLP